MSFLHEVVAHFAFEPPPSTCTASDSFGSIISIGASQGLLRALLRTLAFAFRR